MRVTVYLPPYLVGLKMSDWTLANAIHRLHMLTTKTAVLQEGSMEATHIAQGSKSERKTSTP